MAGYDLDYCSLLRVYGPRWSRGPQTRQKEQGQYQAILTEQAWSIKNLLYRKKEHYFLRDTAGSSEQAR